ncbi:hypothetical protein GGS24DRAFT_285984 [Hypoxylon argillaceum]|nr:hypothetical protein GGS24DRAFT_285984 [Hypoxylon argillaceum]
MIAVGTAQWYWRIQLAGWSLILYHFLVMQSVNCLTAPLSKQRASCMHWHLNYNISKERFNVYKNFSHQQIKPLISNEPCIIFTHIVSITGSA